MYKKFYTHPSPHHKDEIAGIAALCIGLGIELSEVEIIEITNEEVNKLELGKDEYVIDVGLKYDGKNLFDHHQMDRRISAFGLICDSFDKLKPLRETTLRKYIDESDNGSKEFTLKRMGITSHWKNNCDLFPLVTYIVDDCNKGSFEKVSILVDYFNNIISNNICIKNMEKKNQIYYSKTCRIFRTKDFNILILPTINPETGTTNGTQKLVKDKRCSYVFQKGKSEENKMVLRQCGNRKIKDDVINIVCKEYKMIPTFKSNKIVVFGYEK